MAAVVRMRSLSKSYGKSAVIDALDLELGSGVTGLLGPNGAGKTTLLRILATAMAPSSGELLIRGHDPASAAGRLAVRRDLGYVPQELGLYQNFTVFDFVDYVAILKEHVERRSRHDEVRRVIDDVDLGDVRSTKIRKLSDGMRRRVALAQALLGHPELLVLDEPTVGLDPEQRLRFRQIISRHGDRHCVVFSTHLTEDVEALCDRVIVLDRGSVTFDGAPTSLASLAAGRVWVADQVDPAALVSWRSGTGHYRHVGDPPVGAELLAPTVQDGYLLLSGCASEGATT
jgi:ABC-2 type transport system ATP-binding protein